MGFELRFSDKEITAWGGMSIMKRMLDHLEFESALKEAIARSNLSPSFCFRYGVVPIDLNTAKLPGTTRC